MTKTFKEFRESTSVDEISLKSLSKTIATSTGTKNTQKAMKKTRDDTKNDLAALRKRLDALKAGYAAESVELDENKSLIKDYEKYMSQGNKKDHNAIDYLMSMPKYKRMSKDQMAKMIGDHKRKGIFKEEVEQLEELTAAEKKLIDQMYDKKGNLTPLGKKVFAAGQKNEETELDEAPRRKGAPKMTGDSVAIQRAKDAELNKALGRTKTGRKKPVRTMTSTQRSLASLRREHTEVSEAKKGAYDIYHKDFSGAMQHAYAAAKKNYGITIKPSEIDNKVASGPRKPSNGKTNTYRLEGDKGAIQVQVYNTGSKYELNMYKE